MSTERGIRTRETEMEPALGRKINQYKMNVHNYTHNGYRAINNIHWPNLRDQKKNYSDGVIVVEWERRRTRSNGGESNGEGGEVMVEKEK